MTPAQQFSQYLPQALTDIAVIRMLATQARLEKETGRFLLHLDHSAIRLIRYSFVSGSSSCPRRAEARAQAEGYRHSLNLALNEASRLLNLTYQPQPEAHQLLAAATHRLLSLYNRTIPTFPEGWSQRNAQLVVCTAPTPILQRITDAVSQLYYGFRRHLNGSR